MVIRSLWILVWFLFSSSCAILDDCSVEKVYLSPDNYDLLDSMPPYPVIYVLNHSAYKNENLEELASRAYMMDRHGDETVTVSSSNAYSHDKLRVPLSQYLRSFEAEDDTRRTPHANESFYLFGDNYGGVWEQTANAYKVANCAQCDRAGAKSVGIAGRHSGVSFHVHGAGFAEVVHGAKLWLLFPPQVSIEDVSYFGPNVSMVDWVERYVGALSRSEQRSLSLGTHTSAAVDVDVGEGHIAEYWDWHTLGLMQTCVLRPSELIYFPTQWLHGTLNLEPYNHFISTFIDLQLLR